MKDSNDDLVKYFIRTTDKKLEAIETTLKNLDQKIDNLNKFKWKLIGAASSTIIVVEAARIFFELKK